MREFTQTLHDIMSVVPDFKRHQWFLLLAKSRIPDAAWERIQESTEDGTE